MTLVERHRRLAHLYLRDAASIALSVHGRATATWNAGMQIAMAKLTAANQRPLERDWESTAEVFLRAHGDKALNALADWSRDRYCNPEPATEVIADACAAVARIARS